MKMTAEQMNMRINEICEQKAQEYRVKDECKLVFKLAFLEGVKTALIEVDGVLNG